ncbi:MAG: hypothetical protein E6Q40_10595 [Cupriavidus sp.]|nr:MAG: hypothetical protein E6Q40_10595 [Cupriavidus sp.]
MNEKKPEFWFPAKRYGWGWGPPVCWQGWLVMAVHFAAVIAGIPYFIPAHDIGGFIIYSTLLTAVLIVIVAWKGEKPRWRWGGK